MHSDTVGTRHTVVRQPDRKRVRHVTPSEHMRMGAPGGREYPIQAIIGRKRVNPVAAGEYGVRRRAGSAAGSQTQYLVVFGRTDGSGELYPPE